MSRGVRQLIPLRNNAQRGKISRLQNVHPLSHLDLVMYCFALRNCQESEVEGT